MAKVLVDLELAGAEGQLVFELEHPRSPRGAAKVRWLEGEPDQVDAAKKAFDEFLAVQRKNPSRYCESGGHSIPDDATTSIDALLQAMYYFKRGREDFGYHITQYPDSLRSKGDA